MTMDWQPIETAPRDGTPVLIYGPRYKNVTTALCDSNALHWWVVDELEDIASDDDGDGLEAMPPTHWMPLPEPPDGR